VATRLHAPVALDDGEHGGQARAYVLVAQVSKEPSREGLHHLVGRLDHRASPAANSASWPMVSHCSTTRWWFSPRSIALAAWLNRARLTDS
jgi:hypothetical protein